MTIGNGPMKMIAPKLGDPSPYNMVVNTKITMPIKVRKNPARNNMRNF